MATFDNRNFDESPRQVVALQNMKTDFDLKRADRDAVQIAQFLNK